MTLNKFILKGTITAINSDHATIKLETNTTITWPINKLPTNTNPGQIINLTLSSSNAAPTPQTAKDILNELLKTE